MIQPQYFNTAWVGLLSDILSNGRVVLPRGKKTLELPQHTIVVDMLAPVITVTKRALNYRFMAAEAYWILSGSGRVEDIAPFNKNIGAFSDDGERFFGAYGPKVMGQIGGVVKKLVDDESSRQAGLTIWRENPPETKDYPCTIAMWFSIRAGLLNCHVFMRSSDAWLGIPYDVFNFSMVASYVCGRVNEHRPAENRVFPGGLYLTAASSHLYETNFDQATEICNLGDSVIMEPQGALPAIITNDHRELLRVLEALRHAKPSDQLRWWETK
jgi:thymidylate synthase